MKNALKKLKQQSELLQLAVQVIEWNNVARGDDFKASVGDYENQHSLILEENLEFNKAVNDGDIIEQYDAIADVFVVELFGETLWNEFTVCDFKNNEEPEFMYIRKFVKKFKQYNIDCVIDCIKEVMRSNWTKFSSYQLTSNEFNVVKRGGLWLLFDNNGKIRKPECYEAPNLKPILEKHGVI